MPHVPLWIAPRPCCGLGNRLFQTFAAIGAAERTGSEPVLFLPRMCHYEHGEFSLLHKLFPTLQLIETEAEWEEVKELSDGSCPPIPAGGKPVVLSGFFQNQQAFPSENSKHRPRLPDPLPPLKKAWAVHFRFGDYKILPHHQIPLGQFYAQTLLLHVPKGSSLVLFSDSQESLPRIADELKQMGYEPTIWTGTDVLETLKEFSSCGLGAICSNSTFAWWAAYFSQERIDSSPDYKAYFPDTWLRGREAPSIFMPPFTSVRLSDLPASPCLQSFSYQ